MKGANWKGQEVKGEEEEVQENLSKGSCILKLEMVHKFWSRVCAFFVHYIKDYFHIWQLPICLTFAFDTGGLCDTLALPV